MKKGELLKHPEGSIFSHGYGVVPKLPMQDKNLSIEAKAIYAYLCSYMGAGDTAFPSVAKICYDLNINVKRYYRHVEQLKEQGYIIVQKTYRAENGQWANNTYTLVHIKEMQNHLLPVLGNR